MPPSDAPGVGLTPWRAAAAAGLCGCACMVVELSAVRLLAPFFGDSAYVWTNVIGVILFALAAGAWFGGRVAERRGADGAVTMLVAAVVALALAPLLGPWLCDWLLPQDLPLDAAMPALVRGSLAATLALFGPALWLLGAVSPCLVVGAARTGVGLGRAAGMVSAAGTMGSLAGTFAATHWLVPHYGCRATIWVASALLALAWWSIRKGSVAILAGLACAALPLACWGPLRGAPEGQQLLAAQESRIQYLRVVRTPASDGRAARTELKINEGLDSYHSVAIEGRAFTSNLDASARASSYYDYHALVPLLAGDGKAPDGLRALSIGDAAGTFRRIYGVTYPDAVVDAVELDPEVVQLADRWFPQPAAKGHVVSGLDGRVFVERSTDTWHCIHVDAYRHQVYIPAHLASREFFAAARERLKPRGILACNVGGLGFSDPVLGAIARTMRESFSDVVALCVPDSRNILLLGRRDAKALTDAVPQEGEWSLGAEDAAIWAKVRQEAARGPWRRVEELPPSGISSFLEDDRPALDLLLEASYVNAAEPAGPLRFSGDQSPDWAEPQAFEAYARGDFEGVILAASRSREGTAYLCYLTGAAHWSRRRIEAALSATEEGLGMQASAELQSQLAEQRNALRAELAPILRARAVASRNGWLAAACCFFALMASWPAYRMSRMPAAPSVSVSTAAR